MVEPTSSLTAHLRPLAAGAPAVAATFIGGEPALALADGTVVIGDPGAERRVVAHPDGAILVAARDGDKLLTGGDDGRVVRTSADGGLEEIAEEKGRWIDALTAQAGAIAWAAGKQARARDAAGAVKSWAAPTTVRGLAFLPKGYRGRARTSTSPPRPTGASSSLRCRKTRCTAGGSPTRAICA